MGKVRSQKQNAGTCETASGHLKKNTKQKTKGGKGKETENYLRRIGRKSKEVIDSLWNSEETALQWSPGEKHIQGA